MNKIKAYVGWNERKKIHYFEIFTIIQNLPRIGDRTKLDTEIIAIEEVMLDCEQGSDDVYNYNYYKLISRDPDDLAADPDDDTIQYVAIENE